MEVLGEKPYPVLACSSCWQLTGWLGSEERCDVCISSARREAAYADPHGSFVELATHVTAGRGRPPALWKRAAAVVGASGPLERELEAVWDEHVDTGVTGPPAPEEGFVVFGAERSEAPAPEGNDLLVRFSTRAYRFDGGAWQHTMESGGPVPLTPDVFPASLPMDQLAEAWSDYTTEIEAFNATRWQDEDAKREQERQDTQARTVAREEQAGTSNLLD